MTKILFVCLGNICRSPTAEGVLRGLAKQAGVDLTVDSAGTSGWHVGEPPDRRAIAEAARRGFDLSHQRSRQVSQKDFAEFDYVIAMDQSNLNDLRALAPCGSVARIQRLLDFLPSQSSRDVPDPYYEDGFDQVFELIEKACQALLEEIAKD